MNIEGSGQFSVIDASILIRISAQEKVPAPPVQTCVQSWRPLKWFDPDF